MTRIPITKPYFDSAEEQAVAEVLRSGWVVQGPKVKQFEEMFASYCGVGHAVATTSCTTALHLGLLALGVGPGDEVIVPSFTFVATANAVEYCGARPVFCDIDLRTFNIDVDALEEICKLKAQRSKLKGIIPVSLFGQSADMPAVLKIAEKYGLKVLEDAACAVGAEINGRHAGSLADAAAFSFHPRKAITTGEGGMLTTNSDGIADNVRSLRDHGAAKSDLERHEGKGGALLSSYSLLGYNYRMTDIQGAIGVEQMKKLDFVLEGRRSAAKQYDKMLRGADFLIPPTAPKSPSPLMGEGQGEGEVKTYTHSYQSYVVLLSPGDRLLPRLSDLDRLSAKRIKLMAHMEEAGIGVRQGTHAVHMLDYYKKKYSLNDQDFPNSMIADRLTLTLPLYYGMKDEEIEYVVRKCSV